MNPMHLKSKHRELFSLERKSESMVISTNSTSGDIKQALGHMRGATGKS